jgi:hypothetical protein
MVRESGLPILEDAWQERLATVRDGLGDGQAIRGPFTRIGGAGCRLSERR